MGPFPYLVCLAFLAGCVSPQVRPRESVLPPELSASLPDEGIVVVVDRLENKWAVEAVRWDGPSAQRSLEFVSSRNGGRMTMTAYLAVIDLRSLLLVSRDAYQNDGFVISPLEPLVDGTGVRFTVAGPPRGPDGPTRGELRAWEVPGSGAVVVLSGIWLASMHRSIAADFDAVAHGVKASPK